MHPGFLSCNFPQFVNSGWLSSNQITLPHASPLPTQPVHVEKENRVSPSQFLCADHVIVASRKIFLIPISLTLPRNSSWPANLPRQHSCLRAMLYTPNYFHRKKNIITLIQFNKTWRSCLPKSPQVCRFSTHLSCELIENTGRLSVQGIC